MLLRVLCAGFACAGGRCSDAPRPAPATASGDASALAGAGRFTGLLLARAPSKRRGSRRNEPSMKAYLATTATLFSLLALAHFARSIAESSRFSVEPGFWLEGPGIGLIGAALGVWGWRLFRRV